MDKNLAIEIGGLEQALYESEKQISQAEDKLKKNKRNITAGILALVFGALLMMALPGLIALLLCAAGLLTLITGIIGAVNENENVAAFEERLRETRVALSIKRGELAGK